MLQVVQYCHVSVLYDRSDGDLEPLSEMPSLSVSRSYHTRDHTYFYDKLSLLPTTSEAMSMSYWPVLNRPVSQLLTYFHPMLSSPAVVSLAPQVACRTSEFSPCFMRPPLTPMPPSLSSVTPLWSNSRTDGRPAAVRHLRRHSLPTESVESPLDLTVASCKNLLHISPPEGIRSYHMSCSSRLLAIAGVSESAVNLAPKTVRSSDVPFHVTNSSSYVPSLTNRLLNFEPAVRSTAQFSDISVTAPGDVEMPNNGSCMYTAANTGSSALLTSLAATDTKPAIVDASLSQHHQQLLSSSELFVSRADPRYSSANIKPVLTAAVSDRNVIGQMSVTVSEVESSAEESLNPSVTASSLQTGINYPGIHQISVASSTYSGTGISNIRAQYPQVSQMSEQPPHESPSTAVVAVSSCLNSVHSSTSLPSAQCREEHANSLQSDHEASVGVCKMDVDEQQMLGSAGVDIKDDLLLSSASDTGSRPSSEKVADENLALNPAVQGGSAALERSPSRQTVIKQEITVTNEETWRNTPLEHATGLSSKEPSSEVAERNDLSEERTDSKPVYDHTSSAVVSESAADHNDSVSVEDLDNAAVKIEAISGTPESDVNRPSTTASDENLTESKPDGSVSEPGSAAVTVAVNTPPVADSLQQNSSAVRPNGNTDDAATSTATAADTDKNQRFKELMLRCTKALELCLTRFPQHYKSLYRLADVFFQCSSLKVSQQYSNSSICSVSPKVSPMVHSIVSAKCMPS